MIMVQISVQVSMVHSQEHKQNIPDEIDMAMEVDSIGQGKKLGLETIPRHEARDNQG